MKPPILRPSSFPKLAVCPHFSPDPEPGSYAERGARIHGIIASMARRMMAADDILEARTEEQELALRALTLAWRLVNISGVEQRVDLSRWPVMAQGTGTLDAVGMNRSDARHIAVIDYKTGERTRADDYAEQLAVYCAAEMWRCGESHAIGYVIFVDTCEVWSTEFTLERAEEIIADVSADVFNRDRSTPQQNRYCSQCANKPVCPAWTEPAGALVGALGPEELRASFARGIEAIKADPALLGQFLRALRAFEAIIESSGVEKRARDLLENGESVPGWKLQTRKGREFFGDLAKAEILKHCLAPPEELAKAITVNVEKFRAMPEAWTDGCFVEPLRAASTVALVQDKRANI